MIPPQWIDLGLIGTIRISTLVSAIVLLVFITWRKRNPWIAIISIMAWVSLYEIIWYITRSFFHGYSWHHTIWLTSALIAWPFLGYSVGIRPNYFFLKVFAIIWILWIFLGFNVNELDSLHLFNTTDEFLNVLTKTLLAAAYGFQFNKVGFRNLK